MNDPIITIEGKQFYKLTVKAGYYPYMIARDYLGNANAYNQIVRASTGLGLTAESSKTLKAGETLLVPVKANTTPTPAPIPQPTPAPYPNAPLDGPSKTGDSSMMTYYLVGVGLLAFFLFKKKKQK